MTARFDIHVEPAGDKLVWWAETPAVPGLSVAADSLRDLRTLITEAVDIHLAGDDDIRLELVTDEEEPDRVPEPLSLPEDFGRTTPVSVGARSRVSVVIDWPHPA